jgi:hypothetical protein
MQPNPIQPNQVMVDKAVAEGSGGLKRLVPTGTAVLVEGTLAETPEGTKQAVELKATKVGRSVAGALRDARAATVAW